MRGHLTGGDRIIDRERGVGRWEGRLEGRWEGRWRSSWTGYGCSGIRDNKQRKFREGRHLTRGDLELDWGK